MKKRLLAIVLCGLMLTILSACSANTASPSEKSQISAATSEESSELSRQEESLPVPESSNPQTDSSSQAIDEEKEEKKPVSQTDSEKTAADPSPAESKPDPETPPASGPEGKLVSESSLEPIPESIPESTPEADPAPEPTPTEPPVSAFDVSGYVEMAKSYGQSIGLKLDSSATACWDNPIYANADSLYIQRDLQDTLDWYKDSGFTSFWVWTENLGNNDYHIYIGYA